MIFCSTGFSRYRSTGEYLLGISQTGLTLENLDSISSSLDALTLSLDAYATAVQPEIAQFSGAHVLGFLRGTNLEATMESAEQGTDENRITIRGFRPVTDAATLYGSVSYRDTPSATAIAGAEVPVNARTGRCDVRRDTRYSRFKVRIPGGDVLDILRRRRAGSHDRRHAMTAYVPGITETDLKKIVLAIQQLAAGRSNAVGTVTLATGAATTVVSRQELRGRIDAAADADDRERGSRSRQRHDVRQRDRQRLVHYHPCQFRDHGTNVPVCPPRLNSSASIRNGFTRSGRMSPRR